MNTNRYGFNGKENDNEVKGVEGSQQDYGMRIYDPRIGKFLSVDPVMREYPELTPYQFASNRPVDAVDLDGAEARYRRPDGTFSEPSDAIRHPIPKGAYMPSIAAAPGAARMASEQLTAAAFVATAIVGAPYIAMAIRSAGALAMSGAKTSAMILWASTPTNQLAVMSAAGFALNFLNPDPYSSVDLPGYGDEAGRMLRLVFTNKGGNRVTFLAEEGAKFANVSEWKWTQRLLSEGNDVSLLKESTEAGVRTADLLVNGIATEIKEISNMSLGSGFVRNLINKFNDAAGQATSIIIDGTNQNGFTEKVAREALKGFGRKAKENTTFRIVGNGFDFTESVGPRN